MKRAVEDAKPEPVTVPELSDEQVQILRHLFNSGRDGLLLEQMASLLKIKESMAQYHIEALEKTGLIETTRLIMGEGSYYGLSESGRAYMVKHKLCS